MNYAKRIQFLTGSAARTILSNCQSRSITSFAGGLPGKEAFEDLQMPDVEVCYLQYGPSEGEPILREQWKRQLETLGICCDSEQIIVTSGSQQGLDLASKLWIDPGAPIAVETPTYMAAIQVFSLFQADICPIASGTDGAVDFESLEWILKSKKPRFLYLNPTYQNPSGYCYSKEERRCIAEILDRYADQTVLIEDDPYRHLYYQDAAPAQPVVSFLRRAKWVYMGTASKVLIPGLRIGFIATSKEFISPLLKLKQAADLHSNRLAQSMVTSLLSDENWMAARLKRLRSEYRQRRNLMHQVLLQEASSLCDWSLPNGGMFFWLKLKQRVDLQKVLCETMETGVAFMPGDSFFPKGQQQGRYIRLNFTGVEDREIEERLPVIFEVLRKLGN